MYPEPHHTGAPQRVRAPAAGAALGAVAALLMLACPAVQADASWPDAAQLTTNEMMLFEGDILVADGQPSARGIGLRGPTSPWQDGIVPYQIDAELTPASVELVGEAIAAWNEVSGVTMMPLGEAPADLQGSHILFQSGPGCASWVGRQGGEQPLWVGPTCSAGSIMHEIGHALGLEHEHTRPDRDEHIIIHRDKIDPTKLHNFEITDFRSRVLGAYDYASIMHYGPSFFSVDGSPTMEPLAPTRVTIGQRIAPSPGDLESVARLYGTDLSLASELPGISRELAGAGADIDVTLHVTNESDQGANGLTLTLQTRGLEVVETHDENWRCERSLSAVACSLDRLPGNAHHTLRLQLRGQLDVAGLQASLVSVTPDDNTDNNTATVVAGAGSQDGYLPGAAKPTDSEADFAFEVDGDTNAEVVSLTATASAPLAALPDSSALEAPVPLFEQAPVTQTAPTSDTEPPESTAGASVLWLPLLLGVVWRVGQRLTVRQVGLVGKSFPHLVDT